MARLVGAQRQAIPMLTMTLRIRSRDATVQVGGLATVTLEGVRSRPERATIALLEGGGRSRRRVTLRVGERVQVAGGWIIYHGGPSARARFAFDYPRTLKIYRGG